MPDPKPTFEKISKMFKKEYGVDVPLPSLYQHYRKQIFKLAVLALIVEVLAAYVLLSQGMLPTGPITGIVYLIGAICLLLMRMSTE